VPTEASPRAGLSTRVSNQTATEDVQRELANLIASRHLGVPASDLKVGPLQQNYFSTLFSLDAPDGRFIVKIPKEDTRRRTPGAILPLTAADRALGRAEHESLSLIAREWRGDDLRVNWIREIAYVEEYNAIVTERVQAKAALRSYRRLALAHLAGWRPAGRELSSVLGRFAHALRRFHDQHAAPSEVDGTQFVARLRDYVRYLKSVGLAEGLDSRFESVVERFSTRRWPAIETLTLKGIDIRNVLRGPGGMIWLLDPGRLKRAPREADLARFLLTWRILFWGTPWFPIAVLPHRSLESHFLCAYEAEDPSGGVLLNLFLLKETLKHWITARESLALKRWIPVGRQLVGAAYVDPFYRDQLRQLFEVLG
jgi:hypothetical protein